VTTIRAGATVRSQVFSNAKPRHPACSTNAWLILGIERTLTLRSSRPLRINRQTMVRFQSARPRDDNSKTISVHRRYFPMKLSTRWPRYLWLPGAVISIYVFVSYLLLPATWARIEHEPGLPKRPMVTSTAQGIPGDAINVGLIGTKVPCRRLVSGGSHNLAYQPRNYWERSIRSFLHGRSRQSLVFRWTA
jgi:hypothetical protein